jgi:carbonic anhydrase/acetyltransferase-like protein (isoleucine patch superfamily)
MIRALGDKAPQIAESAVISECAHILWDVTIGERCVAFPGAIVRGDTGSIKIGNDVLIEDNVVLHCGLSGLHIGNNVTIGHGAVVNCTRIESMVLIGMNATVLGDVEIGNRCLIAAGTVVPMGTKVPDGSFVVGVPCKVVERSAKHRMEWEEWDEADRSWWLDVLEQYRRMPL